MAAAMPFASRLPEPVELEKGWTLVKGGYFTQPFMFIRSDVQVNERAYTPISRTNRRIAKFLGNNVKMVDWLVRARNEHVAELTREVLHELAVAHDPLAGAVQGPAKRRRVTAGELPQTVNLQVVTAGGEQSQCGRACHSEDARRAEAGNNP